MPAQSDTENNRTAQQERPAEEERSPGRWLWWFIGGGALGFFALCALTMFVLVVLSLGLNLYLAWQISGLEFVIVRPMPTEIIVDSGQQMPLPIAMVTATPIPVQTSAQLQIPDSQPVDTPTPTAPRPTNTPPQTAVLATNTPARIVVVVTATPTPTVTQIETDIPERQSSASSGEQAAAADSQSSSAGEGGSAPNVRQFATTSTNSYTLIPLDGSRESRPAEEHGDLNLKLRDPQPSDAEAELVDYTGFDDEGAPKLGDIFEPNIVAVYTAHDWDWGCNCKGPLKDDGFLVGIQTTPGEPIYIPPTNQDIYNDIYYATLLYASEDSLTFVYNRVGTVANDYAIHYQGLEVDPNLLSLFRDSSGNELPGLTLDTPVGLATDELIVSVRDKGTFMDTRSRKDWWD